MSKEKNAPQVIVRSIGKGTQLQMLTTTGKLLMCWTSPRFVVEMTWARRLLNSLSPATVVEVY